MATSPDYDDLDGGPTALAGTPAAAPSETPPDHVPEWNAAGYDMALTTRYVYAFVGSDRSRVKIGTVSRWSRLAHRCREVANATGDPDLWLAAHVAIAHIDGHVLEGVEASMQTWLAFAAGLPFAGAVDWLVIPEDSLVRGYDADDWQRLMDRALAAVLGWRDKD